MAGAPDVVPLCHGFCAVLCCAVALGGLHSPSSPCYLPLMLPACLPACMHAVISWL